VKHVFRGLAVIVVLVLLAQAWNSPVLWNVCNSAAVSGGTIVVDADCIDSIRPPAGDFALRVFYSSDSEATWQQASMDAVAQPGYDSTYEGRFPAPAAGMVYYYVRADNGTNYGTESPVNTADAWPVPDNLLAETALEGTGDTMNNPDGEWLDLTSCAMGYSAGYIYARLTNHYTSWPTSGGLFGPWYVYSAGFWNSEASTRDTLGYTMTHVNVLSYTDGLYELNRYESTYTRIGDIDIQTSGNRLIMRCKISDLAARPGFQPWPNQCGYLCGAKGDARTANLSLQSKDNDTTNAARFYINRTPRLVVGQNKPPALTNSRVIPQSGPLGTAFWFSTRYSDADSNLPVLHAVVIDGETIALKPTHHQYWGPDVFDCHDSGFAVGPHHFQFVFSDGAALVASTPDTFLVTAGAVAEVEKSGSARFSVEPNPFHGTTVVSMAGSQPRTLAICDVQGRTIRSIPARSPALQLDLRSFPAGVYFLRADGSSQRRLLVKLGR